MLSRNEYEGFFGKITDEEWKAIQKQMDEIQERMWDEDHPLDD